MACSTRGLVPVVMLAAALAGCEEKKAAPPPKDTKKEAPKSASDAKLEAAMAAASASAGNKKADAKDGPPESGIFSVAAADKVMGKGLTAKVEMGSDGSEPRVALLSTAASWKGTAAITSSVRFGARNALPTVEFSAALGPEKKDKDARDKKDKDADAGAPGPAFFIGEILKAAPSSEQLGQLPEGAQKEITKLKGSLLRWKATDTGLGLEPSVVPAKDALADLKSTLDTAAEGVFYLSVPPPPKPIGAGAFWIAGTRQEISGLEVISYRLFRVKSVSPEGIQLTIEGHEYAVSDSLNPPGMPKNTTVQQFESTLQGELELAPKESLAMKGKVTRQVTIGLKADNAPPGALMNAQIVTEARVTRTPGK